MARYDFIEVIKADPKIAIGYWAVIEGHDGMPEIIDNCYDTRSDAEEAGKAFKNEILCDIQNQNNEAAWQAGMSMGCDAYNDFMGF